MMAFDWAIFAWGAVVGTVASGAFFAGLAFGMRLALRAARPLPVLLISAALRIAALLGVGFWVAGHGPWALAGFAATFVVMRFGILTLMRPPAAAKAATWT